MVASPGIDLKFAPAVAVVGGGLGAVLVAVSQYGWLWIWPFAIGFAAAGRVASPTGGGGNSHRLGGPRQSRPA